MADPAKGDKSEPMRIDTKLVRELAAMLDSSNLTEIEVEDGGRRIKVCRAAPGTVAQQAPVQHAPTTASAVPAETAATDDEPSGTLVKSPMVGTAFLSAEPGGKPFASVGDKVKAGDTLLIVEAMKVMNPIIAPSAGTIRKLYVSDAQPVEFDQPLAIIG
ncbi:MAG: acetyl-CoA carboxylase biotin carboxyl carrier protein [Sphingomicrobium sp.]